MESKENPNSDKKEMSTNIWGWKWSWISLIIILVGFLIVAIIGPNKDAYPDENNNVEQVEETE